MNKSCQNIAAACTFLLLAGIGTIPAQSASSIDKILSEDALSFGSASYLLLVSAGLAGDETAFPEAAEKTGELMAFFSGKAPEESLSVGEYSFLLMSLHKEEGGIMYRLAPGPRYAARELSFLQVIQGKAYPNDPISGERAMRILERYLELTGGNV
jgi:hypothetical protein